MTNSNSSIPEKKKSSTRKYIFIGLTIFLLVIASIVYFRYYFVYSEGTRVGILYKFSRKGNVFKTYEGEMVLPGVKFKGEKTALQSNMFHFSVSDEGLAQQLMKSQGMEVELHYAQYNNALVWRGDNYNNEDGQYVVDKLIRIKDKNPNGYGL